MLCFLICVLYVHIRGCPLGAILYSLFGYQQIEELQIRRDCLKRIEMLVFSQNLLNESTEFVYCGARRKNNILPTLVVDELRSSNIGGEHVRFIIKAIILVILQ